MGRRLFIRVTAILGGILLVGLSLFLYLTGAFGAAGYASLQWSVDNGFHRISQVLLAIGAPPSPKGSMLDWHYFAHLTDTPLHYAAKTGNIELLDSLISHGATVDYCCCSCVTPLHQAIINNNSIAVEHLLKAGANVAIRHDMERSSLELANQRGTPEIVRLIAAHNPSEHHSRPVE